MSLARPQATPLVSSLFPPRELLDKSDITLNHPQPSCHPFHYSRISPIGLEDFKYLFFLLYIKYQLIKKKC